MSTASRHASAGDPLRFPTRFVPLAAFWLLALVVVAVVLVTRSGSQLSLLVGNLALLAALLFGSASCIHAVIQRTPASRGWLWMGASMALGALGQALFTAPALRGATSSGSQVADLVGYLGYAVPAIVALFVFPKPPALLISRSRSVLDALVITAGVLFVSESTVLNRTFEAADFGTDQGLTSLAFPIADLGICAVVLTIGMRQANGDRLIWLCLGSGLVILAVTDSIYVRLRADGYQNLTGSPLVLGWMLAPILIGLATLIPGGRVKPGRNLALAVRLVPYVPVLGAMILLGIRPIRDDSLLAALGVILLVSVTVRQVMIVYENLVLTKDLEAKVAVRTAELATLGSIVTSSSDAIVGISLDNVITAWNPAAERLYGYQSAAVIGQNPEFLSPVAASAVESLLTTALDRAELESYELDWVRPDGSVVPVAMTLSTIFDGETVQGISIFGQDITERSRAAAALEQAREEALESSRLKSEFLATMSHEIRTPMNGVIGLTSLLIETDLDATQRKYAEGVQTAGQSLLDVINDILDFSKLEAGKVEIEAGDFDLRRLVEDVGSLLAPAAFAKGLELLVSCPPDAPTTVHGDHIRIRQILLNLASNGVKFTARGEVAVKVTSERLPDRRVKLRFEVVDTGIGIAEADHTRLFQSFSQADASTTRRFGGTGLGLAISRHLVEAMGGQIGVVSEAGVGSTFWFEVNLPLGSPSAAISNPRVDEVLSGRRVLVVDDNATNRTILDVQLTSWHMRVDLVENAAAALVRLRTAAARGRPYDLAVLDMLLPDFDGLQLARSISADPNLAGLPLIMLTSAQRLPGAVLREAGIEQWLTKPVTSSELYDRLMRLMSPKGVCPDDRAQQAPVREQLASRGRILVVEDNQLNQVVAAGMVSRLGYEVDTVADGQQALTAVEAVAYSAILMDCHMPVMDGFAATQEIRRRQGAAERIPIIALTAGAMVSDRERCLAAGMDDYIPKPIRSQLLEAALIQWVPEPANWSATPPETPPVVEIQRDPLPGGGPIDRSRLDVLRSFESPDGSSLLNSLIHTFVSRGANRLAALRLAVENSDFEELSMAAHELRGSAGTIGAVRVAAVCAELERAGQYGSPGRPQLLDELDRELQHATSELADLATAPLS